jgi:GNAT superfamily N-acetyltransferase
MTDDRAFSMRVSTPSDSEAVTALLMASYPRLLAASYESETLARTLPYMTRANPGLLAFGSFHVAEAEAGHLVGCGGWTSAAPGSGEIVKGEAHIRHFATHPEWVGRRVGASLLARCVSDARWLGMGKLHCFSTLNAEPFYRAGGFKTIGSIDVPMGPHHFPAVLMLREFL